MKNLAIALIFSVHAYTVHATKLQNESQLELDSANKLAQTEDHDVCPEAFWWDDTLLSCEFCPPLCKVCDNSDTCTTCIDHAHYDEDDGKCHCNRTLKHWPVTNKCYQPELCENELVFVSARNSNHSVVA